MIKKIIISEIKRILLHDGWHEVDSATLEFDADYNGEITVNNISETGAKWIETHDIEEPDDCGAMITVCCPPGGILAVSY